MAAAPPPGKRACAAGGGELKRIAEIVMVLSAIGNVRSSRDPTPVERALVAEAKARLATVCTTVRPKDLFPKEAVMGLVKDLGLDSSNDRFLRSRPARMSIAEKFLASKRKMENSKALAASSVAHSSIFLPVSDSPHPGSEGLSVHGSHDPIPYEPDLEAVFVEGFSSSANAVSVHAAASPIFLIKQSQVNENQPAITTVESPGISLKQQSTLSENSEASVNTAKFHEMATSASSALQNALALSVQPTPIEVVCIVLANQLTTSDLVKPLDTHGISATQISPQATRDQNLSTCAVQTPLENLFPETNWTSPSTDYIGKSLSCQICKTTINDVESLLVCDACERGAHLKCLQSSAHTLLAKDEWYCPKCLALNNGKPFVPKYGRVRRFVGTSKASPIPSRTQAASKKRAD
ncbi:hypothetical protein J5N97_008100 [Dioscorea zingiberensis]|uniref:PHD-type domain-containing protein n=1 Tax=Dioscorea zingiberensis TaxID=325984 RepID=A0A9D5DE01_9LILI|nr:hypothetical protein J5N97_008100 [Dioscorea zingiberensis]